MNGKSMDQISGRKENGGRQRFLPVALATLLTALLFFADSPPVFAASYVVDTTSDSVLTACTGAAGDCSLRGAMTNANANGGADTITFDPGVTTIALGSALPTLSNDGDIVDATGAGVIVSGGGFACFTVSGNSNVIKGFDGITGCGTGVLVTGDDNTIGGTNIDNDADTLYNEDPLDSVDNDGDTVVDEDPLEGGNVISNNGGTGVWVRGTSGGSGNLILGNHIGTNPAGTGANSQTYGVYLDLGASGNFVGGTGPDGRNLISGNGGGGGVVFEHSGTDGNVVRANYIGINVSGTGPIANGFGVAVAFGPSGNTIGGATAPERNVISGNTNEGVSMSGGGDGTDANLVKGNYIGTNAAGTADLGNGGDGVILETGATANTIGGSTAGHRNIISGNNSEGVQISGATTSGNFVQGNYIGTNAAGTAAVGNSGHGISIGASATGNTIGGINAIEGACSGSADDDSDGYANDGCVQVSANAEQGANCANTTDDDAVDSDGVVNDGCPSRGSGNVISANLQDGINTYASSTSVIGNFIGTNANGSAILGNTDNGVELQGGSDNNTIGGSTAGHRNVISGQSNGGVRIEVGADTNTVSGNYIGTNAAGTAAVRNVGSGVTFGGSGNTIGGTVAGSGNVISGNLSIGVSINNSNAISNTVAGNIIGLNADGTADLGNSLEGVRIFGSATGNTIGGTTAAHRNIISGNNEEGVQISGATSSGNFVQGNYIGTNAAGTSAIANTLAGVRIEDGSDTNTIGGTTAGERNVISGNSGHGVEITGSGTTANAIKGNYIGTNAAGTASVSNPGHGVNITAGASSNTVGGATAGERNIISGNGAQGVMIDGTGTDGNSLKGNYIGVAADGTTPMGNGAGVRIFDGAASTTVGGILAGEGNVIANNGVNGVCVEGSNAPTGTTIRGNSIYANTLLGIDLVPVGCGSGAVTPNDPIAVDGDAGPNNLENYPIIDSATYSGGALTFTGHLDNTDGGTHNIDIYLTDVADGSGNGEGRLYRMSATATGPSGSFGVSDVSSPPPIYAYVTATSTEVATGNTSEFSVVFQTDFDNDGIDSATDNCPVTHNPMQMEHDDDALGDVCDSAVRNRYAAKTGSVITEYTTGPGEEIPTESRAVHNWDYEAGSSIDVGAGVGRVEMSFRAGLGNGACTISANFGVTNAPIELYNATLDNSTGNLTTNPYGDDDSDGVWNGAEKYPAFLNTILDPDRLTGINSDNDGATDEDVADGVNNDADAFTDEDGVGTPPVPYARYFGRYGGSSFLQVLVFEETANARYRTQVIFSDPTSGYSFLPTQYFCGPFEFRQTIDEISTANGVVPGGDDIYNLPANGTRLFTLETAPSPDADGDGIVNVLDKCPMVSDVTQPDTDSDGIGNSCDPTSGVDTNAGDHDLDGYLNASDNCPTVANATQVESEKREPLPFAMGYFRDGMGDACDRNPLGYDLGNVLRTSHYTDAICVGLTDADADGWCVADDPIDTFGSGAAIGPEGSALAGDIGTCTNGVDDDADTLIDSADSGCADQDGDRIPDAKDVCPQAADPLQLETDSGVPGGDACQLLANDNEPYFAELKAYPSRANAHADLRGRIVEPAPRKLHETRGGYVEITDPDWTITAGSSIPDGAIRETLSTVIGATISPSHTCNYPLPATFTLVDGSLNYADVISTESGYGPLVADTNPADGLSDGAGKMPSFLKTAKVLDDDADGSVDEDPLDAVDNDGDGRIDEDRAPLARLFGQTYPPHATHVINVMIYSPVQVNNDGDGATGEDPPDGIDNDLPTDGRIDEDGQEGYKAIFILGDPGISPLVGTVSAFCTPFEARRTRLSLTMDNPLTTATAEGGLVSIRNSATGSTEAFASVFTEQPDADGDLIENALDTCVFLADNDLDTVNDATDTTPWNPRLVSPPGDPDGNGVPAACEPVGGGGGGGMRFTPALLSMVTTNCVPENDCDGDGLSNTADNCFTQANATQTDSDADGIGDRCDPSTQFPDGAIQTVTNGTPVCVTSATVVDADRDGYCAGVDPNDSSTLKEGGFPEIGAFNAAVCNNTFDDDGDWIAAPTNPGDGIDTFGFSGSDPDSGCGDSDGDNIADFLDNCPQTANANQANLDNDAPTVGQGTQQPFLRTADGQPAGAPSQVLGQPFLRTDKWGGDACDPDIDGDYLPNLSEPAGTCLVGDTDPKRNSDCDGDLLGDLAEYSHSTLCVSDTNCVDPVNPCLHPINANFDGNPLPDWKVQSDINQPSGNPNGDFLFNYGEALLFLEAAKAGQVGPNPCYVDTNLAANDDADTFRNGVERYATTSPTQKCSADLISQNEIVDSHPADNNDDKRTNLSDISRFSPYYNSGNNPSVSSYNRRFDMNADGVVGLADISILSPLYNQLCS